jgi:hypothetical protein
MQIFPLEGVNMDMLNFEGLSFPLPAHNIGGEFFNKMSAFNATITDFIAESLNKFAAPQANGADIPQANFGTAELDALNAPAKFAGELKSKPGVPER